MEFEFEGFDTELEDFEVKRTRKFDRVFRIGKGGSFIFTMMHDGIIYANSGDYYVYAIEAKTGKELWRFRANDSNYGSTSTDGKLVFIPSYDHNLYAADIKTGKEVWRFRTGGKIFSTPGVGNGMIFFGSEDENLYALKAETGKLLWKFKAGDYTGSTITFHEGKVFFGSCDHNFYCLDANTGKELWRFRTGDDIQINKEMLIKDGKIYFSCLDNYLYCLDIENGKEVWRFRTGKYGNVTSPFLYDNKLYHPSRDGIVHCLSMDGKELWRYRAGGFVAKCVVYEGIIYFGSEDHHFYALRADDGKELWRFKTGAETYDDGKIVGNLVCFGSKDCNYYGLDRISGEEVWRFQSSNQQVSYAMPIKDEYNITIKKKTHIEDAISEDKYKSKNEKSVSLSDYHVTSEYATTSEYKQKSDYDTSFVMFEEVMEVEGLWISDSKVLTPHFQTLM